ncbi:MAG: tetratricopeptide repeat protein [Myxococcota bacterium]
MADSNEQNPPAGGGEAAPPEQDALFRAQMAVSDFILGYWKYGVYAVGLVLLGALVYGGVSSWTRGRAEDDYAAIARIDYRMPKVDPLARYGLAPMDDPNDAQRMIDLQEGAKRYEAAATDAKGAAAVYAWLKAAETWKRAGKDAEALAATEKAAKLGEKDLAGFTADAAWAAALRGAGRADEAFAHLQGMSTRYEGTYAEESLLQLASAQLDAGRKDEARKTLEAFKTRFPASPRAAQVTALESRAVAGG